MVNVRVVWWGDKLEISGLKLSKNQSSIVRFEVENVIVQSLSIGFEYSSAYRANSDFRGVSELAGFSHVSKMAPNVGVGVRMNSQRDLHWESHCDKVRLNFRHQFYYASVSDANDDDNDVSEVENVNKPQTISTSRAVMDAHMAQRTTSGAA
ncbi:hypothetical protein Tco_0554132 [Tanacetum coccineum]